MNVSKNEGKPALLQRHLRSIKGDWHHPVWIVAAFGDRTYSLSVHSWHPGGLSEPVYTCGPTPYSELWSDLANLFWGGTKAWLIGWRTSYALDRAGFVEALEAGTVTLPLTKSRKGKLKHTGHLTCNRRIVEIDLVCGKNAIKVLDWDNFGVKPEHVEALAEVDNIGDGVNALDQFLTGMAQMSVGVNKTTAAQLGWAHFRRFYQPDSLAVNLDTEARQLERAAYFGGRNECYRLGDVPGTAYSLDVRSCYAWICYSQLLPAWLEQEYRDGCDVSMIGAHDDRHWFADVEIVTDQADYPVAWNNAAVYPLGHFRTALAWPELRHALQHGRVTAIHRAARYAARPVFCAYAEWYLESRAALAESAYKGMVPALKSLFNASLGYTARQKYQWQPWRQQLGHPYWIGKAPHPEMEHESVDAQKLDTEARWLQIAGEPREALPFLHATICSYARIHLLAIFAAAGRENVLYCDTDGILVTKEGNERLRADPLLFGYGIGLLTDRFAPGSCRIQGQKAYSIGEEFIQAGVVKSRFSALQRKRVLTTETGRMDDSGMVHPFVMRHVDGKNVIE